MTGGNGTKDYPPFPEIEREIGHNPARFLLADMSIIPLLRGIQTEREAARYLQIETRTANRPGTKEKILQRLTAIRNNDDGFHTIETDETAPQPEPEATPDATTQNHTARVTDGGTVAGTDNRTDDRNGRTCPDCNSENTDTHELGEKQALWCKDCGDYVQRLRGNGDD